MKIAVIGAGLVGQATGKALSKHGNNVSFVDADRKTVSALKEQGFDAHLSGQYTTIASDITILCVPTPVENGSVQLRYLLEVVEDFAERLKTHKGYHVLVIRSTIPPTTTRVKLLPVIEKISGKKAGKDFGLCMQPEYLRKTTATQDSARPWFILIGEFDTKSGAVIEKLYNKFDAPIHRMGLEEAEFQKYVHNAYNATKIAFFSDMRKIAEAEGWNTDAVFQAVAESSEAVWNPLYGLRDLGSIEGSNLLATVKSMTQWGKAKGYRLEVVNGVAASQSQVISSTPAAQNPAPGKVVKANVKTVKAKKSGAN